MSVLFDFACVGGTYSTSIRNTNIQVIIQRENNGVASLYFRTAAGLQLDIPDGIHVYSRDVASPDCQGGQSYPNRRVLEYPINSKMYVMCPTEKYWVEYQGEVVLTLNPMRAWSIISSMEP